MTFVTAETCRLLVRPYIGSEVDEDAGTEEEEGEVDDDDDDDEDDDDDREGSAGIFITVCLEEEDAIDTFKILTVFLIFIYKIARGILSKYWLRVYFWTLAFLAKNNCTQVASKKEKNGNKETWKR